MRSQVENVMNKKDRAWVRLMEAGHWLGCHQMPERSFVVGDYQFPLCARCTGVLLGEIIGITGICLGYRLKWYVIALFIAIMGIDWFVQYLEILLSTNKRRLVTGTFCGIGVTYCYFYLIRWIVSLGWR